MFEFDKASFTVLRPIICFSNSTPSLDLIASSTAYSTGVAFNRSDNDLVRMAAASLAWTRLSGRGTLVLHTRSPDSRTVAYTATDHPLAGQNHPLYPGVCG